ncbi:hypothetical protein LTR92_003395 [Exophiala xenobiotica]|nr:hypothetical protein LTR92_003395 [Exophiala xenobiotica]
MFLSSDPAIPHAEWASSVTEDRMQDDDQSVHGHENTHHSRPDAQRQRTDQAKMPSYWLEEHPQAQSHDLAHDEQDEPQLTAYKHGEFQNAGAAPSFAPTSLKEREVWSAESTGYHTQLPDYSSSSPPFREMNLPKSPAYPGNPPDHSQRWSPHRGLESSHSPAHSLSSQDYIPDLLSRDEDSSPHPHVDRHMYKLTLPDSPILSEARAIASKGIHEHVGAKDPDPCQEAKVSSTMLKAMEPPASFEFIPGLGQLSHHEGHTLSSLGHGLLPDTNRQTRPDDIDSLFDEPGHLNNEISAQDAPHEFVESSRVDLDHLPPPSSSQTQQNSFDDTKPMREAGDPAVIKIKQEADSVKSVPAMDLTVHPDDSIGQRICDTDDMLRSTPGSSTAVLGSMAFMREPLKPAEAALQDPVSCEDTGKARETTKEILEETKGSQHSLRERMESPARALNIIEPGAYSTSKWNSGNHDFPDLSVQGTLSTYSHGYEIGTGPLAPTTEPQGKANLVQQLEVSGDVTARSGRDDYESRLKLSHLMYFSQSQSRAGTPTISNPVGNSVPPSRPDTPRPRPDGRDPTPYGYEVIQDYIRQSVEPDFPAPDWKRECTPAYEDRSGTPSPFSLSLSRPEADVEMPDIVDHYEPKPAGREMSVPPPATQHLTTGRSVSPEKPNIPPIPDDSGPLKQPKRGDRRKSAVQGGKVEKRSVTGSKTKANPRSRNITRKPTASVGKLVGQAKKASAQNQDGGAEGESGQKAGGKVAAAVKKIEKQLEQQGEETDKKQKDGAPVRRSQRVNKGVRVSMP